MSKKVRVLTYPWGRDKPLDLSFHEDWDVTECRMAGHNVPKLTDQQIIEKLACPIGTKPLRDLAKGRKECVILVGDLCRPFKASQILPAVIRELNLGGISDDHIRFVMALGSHHWMTLDSLEKKLGADIPDRYLVFNHNPFENNVFIGKTSQGNSIYINKEVMECDLKVVVHGIMPHNVAGFSGGSKIILPGISSIETIRYNHIKLTEGRERGRINGNMSRQDMNEAGRMVGIDFIVNQIINGQQDCANIVCGDLFSAHKEGVELARKHYVTKIVNDADIVIGNGYPLDFEAYKAFGITNQSVKEGGDVVILIHSPWGCRGHYGSGRFGKNYRGRFAKKMKRITVVAPHHSLMEERYYGEGSEWVKTWEEALEKLKKEYVSGARVAVYPTAPIQMSEEEASKP